MKTSTFFTAASLAASAAAVPLLNVTARVNIADEDGSLAGVSDYNILSFALVLEHLETAFYNEGVKRFSASDFSSFDSPDLYENLLRLARDEAVHVDVLTTKLHSLRQSAPSACEYKFPFNNAKEFIQLAAIIEGVGVSAYAGASTSIRNPNVLQMAAAILPVEARHDAILRAATGVPPYAAPFDTPLDFNQVWSLASQFIVPGSCPTDNTRLGLTAFPKLALVKKNDGEVLKAGSNILLQVSTDSPDKRTTTRSHVPLHKRHSAATRRSAHVHERRDGNIYAAFLTAQGAILASTQQNGDTFATEVPEGIAGQVYVILVNGHNDVHDRNTVAGPAILEVADVLSTSGSVPSASEDDAGDENEEEKEEGEEKEDRKEDTDAANLELDIDA